VNFIEDIISELYLYTDSLKKDKTLAKKARDKIY